MSRLDQSSHRDAGKPQGAEVRVDTLADLVRLLGDRGGSAALVQLARPKTQSPADGAVTWSGAALANAATRTALGLAGSGVAPGDRVLLFAPGSARWIIACLGLLRLGAIPVPVDSQADGTDLAHIVATSGARRAFTAKRLAARLAEAVDDDGPVPILLEESDRAGTVQGTAAAAAGGHDDAALTLESLAGSLSPHDLAAQQPNTAQLPAAPDPGSEAVLFYTSGTSGPPKGVPLTHRNLLANLAAVLDEGLVSANDRLLLPLPLHHVFPFAVGLLTAPASGVPVVLPHALTGPALARALKDGEVTIILGIPRLYRVLLDGVQRRIGAAGAPARWAFEGLLGLATALRRRGVALGRSLFAPLRRRIGPRLRLLISGGAPLDPDIGARLEGLGWTVATGYGLTETSPILTIMRPGEGRFDTAGRAPPGVELRIGAPRAAVAERGDDGGPDDDRDVGEVQARGPNVFSGYLPGTDGDGDAFTDDGWFRTGDLGSLDAEGWLRLRGRASSRIVLSGGENVDPEAVEARLDAQPAIGESGLLEHEGALAAILVPDADAARDQDPAALREALRAAAGVALADAPSWRRPTRIEIDQRPLPRTRLGKLRRQRLQERFGELLRGDAEPAEAGLMPLGDMAPEDRALIDDPAVAQVWEWLGERFEDRRITPDTDVRLDLGVDSLEWVMIGFELQDVAGLTLEQDASARVETVRDLLREAAAASVAGSDAPGGDLEDRLSNPDAMLDSAQRERLSPPGGAAMLLAAALHTLARWLMRWWFRLDVDGVEHLPASGPCILAPNHESALDPVAIAAVLSPARRRDTFWGGFTERMFRTPWMRLVSHAFRVLPVAPEERPITSLAFGAAALARGGMLIWFPEGHRYPDAEIRPFRPGIGSLARAQGAAVVPCLLRNTGAALPPGAWWPKRRRLVLRIGPAADPATLEAEGSGDEPAVRIADAVRQRVLALG